MSTFDEFNTLCEKHCFNETANYNICTETFYADCGMYPKRMLNLEYLVPVTLVFLLMFLTGLLGNLSVCTVIVKHPSMRSETNMYLLSLAVSDILLLVFGLAPELWFYWQMYPYIFGDITCRLTTFLAATSDSEFESVVAASSWEKSTKSKEAKQKRKSDSSRGTWASALTVLAFSIERYMAICHHSRFGSRGNKRVAMAILGIWAISVAVALPVLHVYHAVTDPRVVYPVTGKVPLLTQTCRIPPKEDKYAYYKNLYGITCVVLFFIPMAVLMLLYIKIALFIRDNRKQARNNGIKNNCSENSKIFKVLVAVVLAFFICGAPFHYQRLTALYIDPVDQEHYRHVFVVTGFFYYLSATINPILYNAISKRYRRAFKEIVSSRTSRQDNIPLNAVAQDNATKNKKMCTTNSYTSVATSA